MQLFKIKKKPHLSESERLFRNSFHVGDKVMGMLCPQYVDKYFSLQKTLEFAHMNIEIFPLLIASIFFSVSVLKPHKLLLPIYMLFDLKHPKTTCHQDG